MKKTTCTLILLLCATLSFAQTSPIKHGISSSFNMANWIGKDAEEMVDAFSSAFSEMGMSGGSFTKGSRLGFSFGYFFQYRMNDVLVLQPEFNYTMRGANYSGDISFRDDYTGERYNFDTKIVYKLNYIEIPLLLKLKKLNQSYTSQFVLFGGPVISFLSSSKLMVEVSSGDDSDQEEEDFDEFEGTEFGYILGIGIEFPSGITADARYYRGMGSVLDEAEIANSVMMVKLGFLF
ncbi:MAG: porin family protein [Candidatus Zhuqueibacterota bacterium]